MRRLLAILLALLVLGSASAARADATSPSSPSFVREALRSEARLRGAELLARLPEIERQRFVGAYVAISPDAADPAAFAGCDDDGDYVLVVTDAMLALVADVARARSFDEANGTSKIADHAAFLARAQLPGRRLLPPPPGFYTADVPGTTADERRGEALVFVLARALATLRGGDVVCSHPTATRERGDAEWTAHEDRSARARIATLSHGDDARRDADATTMVLDAGASTQGALALLAFFERLEIERLASASRFTPTYLLDHPSSVTRASTVRSTEIAAAGSR